MLVSELKKEVETLKAFKPQDDGKWNEVEVRKDDFNHLEKINKRKEQPAKKKQMEPDRKRLRDSDSVKYSLVKDVMGCSKVPINCKTT